VLGSNASRQNELRFLFVQTLRDFLKEKGGEELEKELKRNGED